MEVGFILNQRERQLLGLPEDQLLWPVALAPELLDRIDAVSGNLADIDPTLARSSAERAFALSRQVGDMAILGKMRSKVAPFAGERLGEDVESWLKELAEEGD